MCGFLAVMEPGGVEVRTCVRALRTLRHRGPDDEGVLLVDSTFREARPCRTEESTSIDLPELDPSAPASLFLGHRRLSILDVSSAGHQPMSDASGEVWITYNGEVYNYLELREQLRDRGWTFRTGTDTEVILAAWREWGIAMVERFTGMFAFALWDLPTRTLWLVRDPFGIKPLYWKKTERGLRAASELKALLRLEEQRPAPNEDTVLTFLDLAVSDAERSTFFRGIEQVPPGSWVRIRLDDGTVTEGRYWSPGADVDEGLDWDNARRQVRELVVDSVDKHLRSDVPVGACLSGGIDSSTLVSCMRHLHDELPIHGISFIAEDPRISEEKWIAAVVREKRATLHPVTPRAEDFVADLPTLIRHQDEPFCTTSIYAQYRVFQEARAQGVTVMLDGQGADELFAGYTSFYIPRLRRELLHLRLAAVRRLAAGYGLASGISPSEAIRAAVPGLAPRVIRRLLRGKRTQNKPWLAGRARQAEADLDRDPTNLNAVLNESLTFTSLPMLLRFEDRNSMAHSIESRVPFLTTAIADLVRRCAPSHLISPDGVTKHVLREAMRGIVPDLILDRRDKIGFKPPEADWMRGMAQRVTDVFDGARTDQFPMVRLDLVRTHWRDIVRGERAYATEMWRLFNLYVWADQMHDTLD